MRLFSVLLLGCGWRVGSVLRARGLLVVLLRVLGFGEFVPVHPWGMVFSYDSWTSVK